MLFFVCCRYTPGYPKPTTWIVTPRVREVVRRHFNCSSLLGMAMEDLPGDGVAFKHWEARLTGPEVKTALPPSLPPSLTLTSMRSVSPLCVPLLPR